LAECQSIFCFAYVPVAVTFLSLVSSLDLGSVETLSDEKELFDE
jgi:hypothetical protein